MIGIFLKYFGGFSKLLDPLYWPFLGYFPRIFDFKRV